MEHTKKMILIEPEVIERLKSVGNLHEDSLSRLDKEMQNILKSKMDDREKWSLYMQILQRYLHFTEKERKPLRLPVTVEDEQKYDMNLFKKESKDNGPAVSENSGDNKHVPSLSADALYTPTYINNSIPKTYRKKGEILLDALLKNKDKINWKNDGLILIDNEAIVDSNIVDLVNYTLRPLKRPKPNGWEKFIEILKNIGVPSNCIGNPEAFENISNISPKNRRHSLPNDAKSPKTLTSYKLRKKQDVWERWNPY